MEFSKFVPQLFFDFLVRVISGAALLVGLSIALNASLADALLGGFKEYPKLQESWLFLILILSILAYVAGHIMGPISEGLEHVVKYFRYWRLLRPYFEVVTQVIENDDQRYPSGICTFFKDAAQRWGCRAPSETDDRDSRRKLSKHHTSLLFVWLASIRLRNEDAGARLVKIRAEFKMQSQLAAAALIVLILHLAAAHALGITAPNDRLVWGALGVALLSIANYCQLYYIFQLSVINHCYAAAKGGADLLGKQASVLSEGDIGGV